MISGGRGGFHAQERPGFRYDDESDPLIAYLQAALAGGEHKALDTS